MEKEPDSNQNMQIEQKKITLVSKLDNHKISIDKRSINLSNYLLKLTELYQDQDLIIPDIDKEYLQYIVEFLEHYNGEAPEEVKKPLNEYNIETEYGTWESEYINTFINDKLKIRKLMEVADLIGCKPLLDLAGSAVACHIVNFTNQEILDYFDLKEDLTEEEHAKMKEEFKLQLQEQANKQKESLIQQESEEDPYIL